MQTMTAITNSCLAAMPLKWTATYPVLSEPCTPSYKVNFFHYLQQQQDAQVIQMIASGYVLVY